MTEKTGPYDVRRIERKWRERWAEAGCFAASEGSDRPRFFNFDGGPFPNGPLHMGHVRTFTLGDVMARYQRMQGKNVLYCLEFDAFGLPNELAARERGISPEQLTRDNIRRISEQMMRLGLSYDWRHVHVTCDPRYYKWTQWLFLRLLEWGLIYRAPASLNWCPNCMTTLAHMQVTEGRCWRCETKVEQRLLTQWFVRLSEYSSLLFETLSDLDGWSDPMRHQLRGFLGPSRGIEVDFEVVGHPGKVLVGFGSEEGMESAAAYLAAAPGHPEIESLLAGRPEARPVHEFLERLRSEPTGRVRRRREDEEASGRDLDGVDTGIRVIDPLTGAILPVFVARFVDPHFATGIEIGRPGASERDAEFARLQGLRPPARSAAEPRREGVRNVTHFRVRDWLVSRQRSWGTPIPILYCETCGVVPVPDRDLPLLLPKALAEEPPGRYGLRHYPDFVHAPCPRCGRDARRETDTLDCYFDVVWCFLACSTRLDDSFAFRAEDFASWMPVDWFHNGLDSFFYAHLYRFIGRVLFDMKILPHPEPVRRYSGHDAVLSAGRKMSKHHGNVVAPDTLLDQVGADVLRVHVLWAARPLKSMEWSDTHLERARRFLESVWELVGERSGLVQEHGTGGSPAGGSARSRSLERLLARTVERVTVFLEDYRYNACLEEINTFVRALAGFARDLGADPADRAAFARSARVLVLLLAPFAPHLSEELWERIGGEGLAATTPWPRVERTRPAGKPQRPESRRIVSVPLAEP